MRSVLFALLLLVPVGCTARPLVWVRRAVPPGLVGLNHVISHIDALEYGEEVCATKLRIAREMGAQSARIDLSWRDFVRGRLDVRGRWLIGTRAFNMEPLGLINVDEPSTGATLESFARYCRALVTDYGSSCHLWEIGNEPNNESMSPERYAELLRVAYREIKAVQPQATVITAGLGHTEPVGWLRRVLQQPGVADSYDAVGVHPYDRGWTLVRDVLKLTDKPLWITEDGKKGAFINQALRGSLIKYLEHPRISAVFWYCLCDYGTGYGLLQETDEPGEFTPRPGYDEFKTLMLARRAKER
jgi:hypothetical protein